MGKEKTTDIGNSYEIFVDFLGYSEKESELLLSTDWIPVFSKDPNHPMNKCLSVNSLKSIKSLFLNFHLSFKRLEKVVKLKYHSTPRGLNKMALLVNSVLILKLISLL